MRTIRFLSVTLLTVAISACSAQNALPSRLSAGSVPISDVLVHPMTFASVYAFKGGKDGAHPYAGLVLFNGRFYGTTYDGGAASVCPSGCGTIFSLDPGSLTERVVYRFKAGQDGAGPWQLVALKGKLYGTTSGGGSTTACRSGCGTIFSFEPLHDAESVNYRFKGGTDGYAPFAGLAVMNGKLYGTTLAGGTGTDCSYGYRDGCGTIFSFDPSTDKEATEHDFKGGHDGSVPRSDLYPMAGTLYGSTTSGGGTACGGFGCGTIVTFNPSSGIEKVRYHFKGGGDGFGPAAGLTLLNGLLYGTTYQGGDGGYGCYGYSVCGTLFSFDPSSAKETVLYRFGKDNGKNGEGPQADLTPLRGLLYGTTLFGGSGRSGVVFSFNPVKKVGKVLHRFTGFGGSGPYGALLPDNGKLYGTTVSGGNCPGSTSGCGTIFSL